MMTAYSIGTAGKLSASAIRTATDALLKGWRKNTMAETIIGVVCLALIVVGGALTFIFDIGLDGNS